MAAFGALSGTERFEGGLQTSARLLQSPRHRALHRGALLLLRLAVASLQSVANRALLCGLWDMSWTGDGRGLGVSRTAAPARCLGVAGELAQERAERRLEDAGWSRCARHDEPFA